MKTPEQYANELIERYRHPYLDDVMPVMFAIIDVKNTIEALEKHDQSDCGWYRVGQPEIPESYYQEVLTILKNK